jgi:2-hydroxychromene-2-carboxylate isomerase/rhodanese-related sulfurtransferase
MTAATSPIDFWFDFSSPYSYLASTWIDGFAAQHGRTVRWHALLLGATFKASELRPPASYPVKGPYMLRDFARSAQMEGLPYQHPDPFPIPTQHAARVFWWLHAQAPQQAVAWAKAGLKAYFTEGVALNDAAALKVLLAREGFDAQAAEAAWGDETWKAKLVDVNTQAVALGVFGAPFFIVDGEPFWGNDRRAQMARHLQVSMHAPALGPRKTAQDLVQDALTSVTTVGVHEALAKQANGALLVDLRDARELEREGLVAGSFHAPRGMLEFWVDDTCEYHKPQFADRNRPYVLYCAAGWRSALAAHTMQTMGFANVSHLDGGFAAWREAGAPVAQKVKKPS